MVANAIRRLIGGVFHIICTVALIVTEPCHYCGMTDTGDAKAAPGIVLQFLSDSVHELANGCRSRKRPGRCPVRGSHCPRRRRSTRPRSTSGANTPPRKSLNSSARRGPRPTGQSSAPMTLPPQLYLHRRVRNKGEPCAERYEKVYGHTRPHKPQNLNGCCAVDFSKMTPAVVMLHFPNWPHNLDYGGKGELK